MTEPTDAAGSTEQEESAAGTSAVAAAPPANPWANAGRLSATLAAEARAPPPAAARAPRAPAVAQQQRQPAVTAASDGGTPAWDVSLLSAAPAAFERRGLVNSGNLCYLNSSLQALLGCSAFVALLRFVAEGIPPVAGTATPTLRSLAALAAEFPPAALAAGRLDARGRGGTRAVCSEELFGTLLSTFEAAAGVQRTPREARRATRGSRQQQDAQEFISALLESAHGELALMKQHQSGGAAAAEPAATAAEDEDAWECVGRRRNASFVARTHQELATPNAASPISDVFGGVQASVVKRAGAKASVTQEPFKMLSLDIGASSVWTLEHALAAYCAPEPLEGYRDSKGTEVTAATRSLHIVRAPRVLLLHLKLFAFTEHGEEKLRKRVQFGDTLLLDRSMCGGREGPRYRLAALIEHIGSTPRSGHYVAFSREAHTGAWLRFDDAQLQTASLEAVLARPAYILAYEQV